MPPRLTPAGNGDARRCPGSPLCYLGSAPVSVVSSDDTGASGLFAEPPECGVTDTLGVEPSAVPTAAPAELTTVAVAVAPVVSAEPIAPAVLPAAPAPAPIRPPPAAVEPAAPASAPPACDSAAGPFANAPFSVPAGLPPP
ncbi:hypothetical protein [Burkholderia ubonensis]|uniref:hypothetical protein n=1 Tax=Burkholderia ubonensis TaxID=101571 RepID=UPI0012F75B7A|nr:hypothetical protein [Burkholderia ubonensis]